MSFRQLLCRAGWKKLHNHVLGDGILTSSVPCRRGFSCSSRLNSPEVVSSPDKLKTDYDAIIIGAGHNGLVAAAYLAMKGMTVCVLEKRHVIGGAAVTEELVPGFKFSRASYVLSLLRPQIHRDLELKKYGLKVFLRNPNSYTPLRTPGGRNGKARSLLLSRDEQENKKQIAQFSEKDAEKFGPYEAQLERMVSILEPLLDTPPPNLTKMSKGWMDRFTLMKNMWPLIKSGRKLGGDVMNFYELLTGPASKVLDKWFESEPLKATLATDAVIGAMTSPKLPGSGYVLLHHVMGELEGVKGAWGYVEGGMGNVSVSIARSAVAKGASIFTNTPIKHINTTGNQATSVVLDNGTEVRAKVILSNATSKVTYLDLMTEKQLPEDFIRDVSYIDYTSPVTKINVAVSSLPNFTADPVSNNQAGPQHRGTIHLNSEHSDLIHDAYLDAMQGHMSTRPVIEMTIPSSLDQSVAPSGAHVVQLFTQYTPYTLAQGRPWDDQAKKQYQDIVFNIIEEYAPGFKESVVGVDLLTPPDIERVFGLTGGNIFHGAMSLDQLFFSRPLPAYCDYRSPIKGLYMCGSSAHPGGGVMGSTGRLAASVVLSDLGR